MPVQTYPASACPRYSGLRIGSQTALRLSFSLPRKNPSDRLSPRKTHSCAYSTGCQLRTLTGFPYPHSCPDGQSFYGETASDSIFLSLPNSTVLHFFDFCKRAFQKNRRLQKAGADFCYPIMRLNFGRKPGGNPLLRVPKIKQFQGFAACLSTCRPCRPYREPQGRLRGAPAYPPPETPSSGPWRRRKRRSPARNGSPWRDR